MINLFIRYFFIMFCTIYVYMKIKNYTITISKISHIFILTLINILPIFVPITVILRLFIIFFLFILQISIYTNSKPYMVVVTSFISFSISLIALAISGFVVSVISTPFIYAKSIINSAVLLTCGLIQFSLIYLLFKIKRLRNGMPFIQNLNNASLGMELSFLIFLIFIILQAITLPSFLPQFVLFMFILLISMLLLIWWRRKITQSYVEKLRVSEVESLYKEISDKDLEIEKLHANNEQLARIIHKDNKLIPAMELAVRNYLQSASRMEPGIAEQMGMDLLAKLERMSEERTGIIHTYQEKNAYRQRCGLASIDAIIDYMEKRAVAQTISFEYRYDKNVKEMLPAYINEDDAMHLLSDVIENAIIASTHAETKNMLVHIGFIQSNLFMDISDSGIPFTTETFQNFGVLQYTTHKEQGGSGIGLMDLTKLKKKYKFSLHIYEYPDVASVYTKKIRILFDRKNHFLIQSYRAKELRSTLMRNDLHILPFDTSCSEVHNE